MNSNCISQRTKPIRWFLAFLFLFANYFDSAAQCNANSPIYALNNSNQIVTVNTTTGVLSAPITTIPTTGTYAVLGVNPNTGLLLYMSNATPAVLGSYNPTTNVHTTIGTITLPSGVINKGAVAPDGKFYFSGGTQLWVYDPTLAVTTGMAIPTATTNPKLVGTLIPGPLLAIDMNGGDIAFDGLGNMWAVFKNNANANARLVRFLKNGSSVDLTGTIIVDESLFTSNSQLNGMAFDNADNLYIGSAAGFSILDIQTGLRTNIGTQTAGNHNTADLASCFMPRPILTISKSVSPTTTIASGELLTYTIAVTNTGNLFADDVRLTDVLPLGTEYTASSVTINGANTNAIIYPFGNPGGEINSSGQVDGRIASGATATITFKVNARNPYTSGQPITNQASLTFAGNTTPINSNSVSTNVVPNTFVVDCDANSPTTYALNLGKQIVRVNNTTGAFISVITTIPAVGEYTSFGLNSTTGVFLYIANYGSAPAGGAVLGSYNPATNVHTTLGNIFFPAGTNINKGAITPDGKFYFSGGDQLWVYDPALAITTGMAAPTTTSNPRLIGTLTVPTLTSIDMGGGDIAFDGFGNLWAVFQSSTAPTVRVVQFPTVGGSISLAGTIKINQTLASKLSGIAFDPTGGVYVGSAAGFFRANTDAGTLTPIGPSTATNHATGDLATCFQPRPNLTISKSVSPTTTVAPGDILTYTIVVTNTGSFRADGVTLVDALPSGVDYVANSVTLNGTNISAATYPYGSPGQQVNGTGQVNGALTSSTGTAPTATVTFQVRVKNPFSGALQITNQASVTSAGNPTPIITSLVTNEVCPQLTLPINVSVCAGQSPTLTVTSSLSGTNVVKFVKFTSAQTSSATIYGGTSIGSATPNTTTGVTTFSGSVSDFPLSGTAAVTYYVYAIIDPAPTNAACRPFAEIRVTVNPLPTLTLVGAATCAPNSLTYSVSFTSDGTVTSSAGTVSGNTVSGITAGTNVTLTATSGLNCVRTLVVTAPDCNCPVVTAPVGTNRTICQGATIPALSVSVGAGETADWFSAAAGGVAIATGTLSFTPTAAGTFYAEARNTTNNCKSLTRTAVILTVNPLPTLTLNGAATCAANLLTYSVTFTSNGTVTSSAGTVSGNTVSGIPIATNVTLTATSSPGCVATLAVNAPVCTCPLVTAPVGTNRTICQGEPIPALSVSVGMGETADWFSTAAGGVAIATGTLSFTPTAAGTFYAETRNIADNCKSSTRTAVILTVNPLPTLTLNGSPVCSVDLQTYSVTFSAVGGTVTASAGTISGNSVTGIPSNTNITLTITNATTGCRASATVTAPNCSCPPANPVLITPNAVVCIGDTIPTFRVFVSSNATADWYAAATGGTALATGTTSYKPTGIASVNTTFYVSARGITQDCQSLSPGRVAVLVTVRQCVDTVDLALKKLISKKVARIGDELVYTIKVFNQSNKRATGVEVTDSIATTVEFVVGSFVASRGSAVIAGNVIKWTIGNISAHAGANGDTVTLSYKVKGTQTGVHFNTAEISKTNEKDKDSTPSNGREGEDDIDRQCFTVPFKLCSGEVVEVNVPSKYTNVVWSKTVNGQTTQVGTGNQLLLSEIGSYSFTATNQTCPASGCCPIIVEASTNCCSVPQLCVPFTTRKIKVR